MLLVIGRRVLGVTRDIFNTIWTWKKKQGEFPVVAALLVLGSCSLQEPATYQPSGSLALLDVGFADQLWDGLVIPDGQQCNIEGGKGFTPSLIVGNIPESANLLIMEYSDKYFSVVQKPDHGSIGYRINKGSDSVTIPSIPGHTFEIGEDFQVIKPHGHPDKDTAGAYLPPCSGGQGNYYYVTVTAYYESEEDYEKPLLIGRGKLALGRY